MNAVRDNEILATYSRHYKGRAGTEPHAYLGMLQPNAGSALTLALFANLWREQWPPNLSWKVRVWAVASPMVRECVKCGAG
jgi:hypothetical protein